MAELATFLGSINLGDLDEANSLVSRILDFMQGKYPGIYAKMPHPSEADDSDTEGFSTYQDFNEYMYELAWYFEEQDKHAYLDFWFSMIIEDPDQVKDYLFPPMGYSPQMQEECLQLLNMEYNFDAFYETRGQDEGAGEDTARRGVG